MKSARVKTCFVVIMTLIIGACSTNSLLIRYFYGQMDNRMQERILDYASFSPAQKSEIRQSVDTFFLWHRTNELPKYAAYLDQLGAEIEDNQFNQSSILEHLRAVRRMSQDSFARSPLARAAPFLKSLSDAQVLEIEARLKQKDDEFEQWYAERQKNDGDVKRVEKIVKNIGRLGIKLNQNQSAIIQSGLDNYRGGPEERFEVWNRWESELVGLLQQRTENVFEQAVSQHLSVYQNQMQLHSPDNHAHNQTNTANIINELLLSLTEQQKTTLLKRLDQASKSLIAIANR